MSELPSGTQPQAQDDDTSENKRHPDSTVSEQSLAASSSPESPSSSAAGGDQAPRPDSVQVPGSTTKRRVDLTRKSGRFLRAYLTVNSVAGNGHHCWHCGLCMLPEGWARGAKQWHTSC